MAEAISGFANADGGVLIYGLSAKGGDRTNPDVVTGVEPVKNLLQVHPEVLSLVGQLIEPPVSGVRVESRPFDRVPDSGFVLVYVPASEMMHRSRKDREFYRRHGTGFHRMEYFEIAEGFGRQRRPLLRIAARFKEFIPSSAGPIGARYVVSLEWILIVVVLAELLISQSSPKIPTRYGPERPPSLSEALDIARSAIDFCDRSLESDVSSRKHIRIAKNHDSKNCDGPRADTLNT